MSHLTPPPIGIIYCRWHDSETPLLSRATHPLCRTSTKWSQIPLDVPFPVFPPFFPVFPPVFPVFPPVFPVFPPVFPVFPPVFPVFPRFSRFSGAYDVPDATPESGTSQPCPSDAAAAPVATATANAAAAAAADPAAAACCFCYRACYSCPCHCCRIRLPDCRLSCSFQRGWETGTETHSRTRPAPADGGKGAPLLVMNTLCSSGKLFRLKVFGDVACGVSGYVAAASISKPGNVRGTTKGRASAWAIVGHRPPTGGRGGGSGRPESLGS